jgi:hypothetical protein
MKVSIPVIKDNGDHKDIEIYLQGKEIVFNIREIHTSEMTFNAADLLRAVEFLAKKGK